MLLGNLMTFAGDRFHYNKSCKNIFHYPLQRLNALLQLKWVKRYYG
jgi:hypothetical protein